MTVEGIPELVKTKVITSGRSRWFSPSSTIKASSFNASRRRTSRSTRISRPSRNYLHPREGRGRTTETPGVSTRTTRLFTPPVLSKPSWRKVHRGRPPSTLLPDLVTADYFLFPTIKRELGGGHLHQRGFGQGGVRGSIRPRSFAATFCIENEEVRPLLEELL